MSESASAVPLPGSVLSPKPVSIDRAVEEGMLIVTAGLTMEVKNQIIIDAIRGALPYDSDRVADIVTRELLFLAQQNDESSDRVQHLAADVLTSKGSRSSEGYQAGDHPALANRAVIHSRVSAELERLAADPDYIRDVAETARGAAWAEVGDAVQSRLLREAPLVPDPRYDEDKDARIKALFDVDFRALEKRAKKLGLPPVQRNSGGPAPAPRRFWQRRKTGT